jgi:hypothetical protein
LFSDRDLLNWRVPPVKIVSSRSPRLRSHSCATPLARAHSSIAVKVNIASVLLQPNASVVYATQSRLVRYLRCMPDLLRKSYSLGKTHLVLIKEQLALASRQLA